MKRKVLTIVCVLAVLLLTFAINFWGAKIENPSILVTIFLWLTNLLLSLGGASMAYNEFFRYSGFYIGMRAMLKNLEQFLGDKKHYDSSDVFWIMIEEPIAIQHGMSNINPTTLKRFKEVSDSFYNFICNSKNNVSPNGNSKKWYASQDVIINFLLWGKNCEHEEKLSIADVERYYFKLTESINYIFASIDEKVDKLQIFEKKQPKQQ